MVHFALQRYLWAEVQLAPPEQFYGPWWFPDCQTYWPRLNATELSQEHSPCIGKEARTQSNGDNTTQKHNIG